LKEEKDQKKKRKHDFKLRTELIKVGIVEDSQLLNDFQVKTDQIPLRKLKPTNSIVNERFENMLKRNTVGEYSHPKLRKRNRKLNKMAYREGGINTNDDYGYSLGDETKLKIFE